ncbi:hypothetical protein ABEB36_007963 [Hypothenemus hampei]|uniref:Uncharacterized protein n=1 Tax=Hypothenemus hampei TaxID=57062 RepID=A0ABD1EVW8_HYPHA
MQSETNAFYGMALPAICVLKRKLSKIAKKNNFQYCKPSITTFQKSIERRFVKFFDVNSTTFERCLDAEAGQKILNIFKTLISKHIGKDPKKSLPPTKIAKKEKSYFHYDSDSDSDNSSNDGAQHIKTNPSGSGVPLPKAELLMLHFFAEEDNDLEILNRS